MFWELLQQNLFNIVQSIFLFLGFGLAAKSYDDRSRQVGHLLQLGEHYQKIKNTLIHKPELARIFESNPDKSPEMSPTERNYIQQNIMHIYTVFIAVKLGQLDTFEGIDKDIKRFLNLPLPAMVWEEVKEFQDKEFVTYIEKLQRR